VDLSAAFGLIDQLVANGKMSRDFGRLMKSQVNQAQNYISQGKNPQAVSMLKLVVLELDLLVQFRQMTPADAAPLRNLLTQVITQLGGSATTAQTYWGSKRHKSCVSHQRPLSHSGHHRLRIHRRR
jgi:hypothetical protein